MERKSATVSSIATRTPVDKHDRFGSLCLHAVSGRLERIPTLSRPTGHKDQRGDGVHGQMRAGDARPRADEKTRNAIGRPEHGVRREREIVFAHHTGQRPHGFGRQGQHIHHGLQQVLQLVQPGGRTSKNNDIGRSGAQSFFSRKRSERFGPDVPDVREPELEVRGGPVVGFRALLTEKKKFIAFASIE